MYQCVIVRQKEVEVIGCLVPELQIEMHVDAERNFSQCFYIAKVNFNVSLYYRVTLTYIRVLVKQQLESRRRQLEKTTVVSAGAYIVSMDRKTTVYGLEAGKVTFFQKRIQAIATRSRRGPVSSLLTLLFCALTECKIVKLEVSSPGHRTH